MKRRRFYEADGSQEKRSGAPCPKGRPQESNLRWFDVHRAWRRHAIGAIRPESAPPHNLSRDVIEASITKVGFQSWRIKSEKH